VAGNRGFLLKSIRQSATVAAIAMFALGMICPGHARAAASDIWRIKVEQTWLAGERVY
jgi:hypothetical protein